MREDSKRASSVEGHPTDSAGIDVVLVQDTLNRGTDASPDVICGLLLYRTSVSSLANIAVARLDKDHT